MRAIVPAGLLLVLVSLLALPFCAVPAAAQAPAPTPTATASADTGPVAVPQPTEKAMRYYRSGSVLWVIGTLWGLAVPLVLLFTGFSARLRDASRKIGRSWFFTVAVYGVLFSLLSFVLDLPLSWYQGFVR